MLTLMKGDKIVEIIQEGTYFSLFLNGWSSNLDLYEVGFMYAPLSIDDSLSPFDHCVDEIFSHESTTNKIGIGKFSRLKNAVNWRNTGFSVLV